MLDQILNSGDPGLIANSLDEETILEHFGENSFEYLAYQHSLVDISQRKVYKIPRRTEDPADTAMGTKSWIREFHELNGMQLPIGFSKKNKRQLRGMYLGMLNTYKVNEEQIFSREELDILR